MAKRQTTEDFINKAREKHGDKYIYSEVEYTISANKVNIICKEHGVFSQLASNHLAGYGCIACADNAKRITSSEFVKRASELYSNQYDYSLVNEIENSRTRVKVVCPKHGTFTPLVVNHLRGQGCAKCKVVDNRNDRECFIKKSLNIHGDLYDYSLVDYTSNKNKVKIICKTHGVFEQTPTNHLKGSKCGKCRGYRKTTEEFVNESNIVHENRYAYSECEYKDALTKVKITCKIHGNFEQSPSNHLQSQGCPECSRGGYKKRDNSYVYVIKCVGMVGEFCGYGISSNLQRRLKEHTVKLADYGYFIEDKFEYKCAGETAVLIEKGISQNFETVNTGIDGFKKEATNYSKYNLVVNFVKGFEFV
jgi:hypothetical protein